MSDQPRAGLPIGFRISFDPDARQFGPHTLYGGSPARVLRLSPAGARACEQLRAEPVGSAATASIARRLTDVGVAHPVPPELVLAPDVTVVIPAHDRLELLERCLNAVGARFAVLVVDDGSADRAGMAAVVERAGAQLVRRAVNGGPAAARNSGLALVQTEFVALLDSDCVPPPGWIEKLAGHFADPLVAAVAPRVIATAGDTSAGRYGAAGSSLDLGGRPAIVRAGTRVSYVPTAALLVRRSALAELAALPTANSAESGTFDPALRFGEDVDLVWRLIAAGWIVRYDPTVAVPHQEPQSWPALLARRYAYGTSAAPLARRHPASLAPAVLPAWPSAAVFALLARRPILAASGVLAYWLSVRTRLAAAGLPPAQIRSTVLGTTRLTWFGVGRYGTQFASPLLALGLLARPRGHGHGHGHGQHGRRGRRAAILALALSGPIAAYRDRRPAMGPAAFTLARLADDAAYGAGVLRGCLAARTVAPLTPRVVLRPFGKPR